MKLKIYILIFFFAISLSAVVNADAYVAGPDRNPLDQTRQYFPPGWIVRIAIDNCQNSCDVGVQLPDNTIEYIARDFQNPRDCLWNVRDAGCYVDYTIPDMEGLYQIASCYPTNCNLVFNNYGGWFRAKKMPALENLKAKDNALEEKTNNLFEEIRFIVQCLLSKGFVCPVKVLP